MLSHFSRVQLCATPQTAAYQAPVPGIIQARILECCHFLLQCVKVKSLSPVRLLATLWTAAYQAPPSMGFPRQEYWSGEVLISKAISFLKPFFSLSIIILYFMYSFLRYLLFSCQFFSPTFSREACSKKSFSQFYLPSAWSH